MGEAWEEWRVTWAGLIQRSRFDQGKYEAHRGGNPGTRLLCPLPPATADRHLISFTLSRKTAQKRAKLRLAGADTSPLPKASITVKAVDARAVHAHKTSALRTILDIIDINRARGRTWNQVLRT